METETEEEDIVHNREFNKPLKEMDSQEIIKLLGKRLADLRKIIKRINNEKIVPVLSNFKLGDANWNTLNEINHGLSGMYIITDVMEVLLEQLHTTLIFGNFKQISLETGNKSFEKLYPYQTK